MKNKMAVAGELIGRFRLFNTRDTRVTLPHLTKVYHLVSCTGTNEADRMVQLSQASGCYSGVAGVE